MNRAGTRGEGVLGRSPAVAVADRVAGDLVSLVGVRAVALGGSRSGPLGDAESDIDFYVYADELPSLHERAALIAGGREVELNNQFWETGDEWLDADSGIALDVMYRSPAWVEGELDRLLNHHQASIGYTTAVWHNLRTCQVLEDPSGWLMAVKEQADQPYSEELRRAIVAKNHPILRTVKGAYRNQLTKALNRDDVVSVNHRLAALLESVFDILFAVNRQTHPGEKRLLAWTEATCAIRPPRFDAQIRDILAAALDGDGLLSAVDALLDGLDVVLVAEGLLDPDEVSLENLTARFIER